MKFEASPRPDDARPRGSRWRSLLATPHVPTREEIERDAAAQVGVRADLVGGRRAGAPAPEAAEHTATEPEVAAPGPAGAPADRRPGRLAGWWRDVVSPEPAEARRRRLEAEAAAELGLHDDPQHAAR